MNKMSNIVKVWAQVTKVNMHVIILESSSEMSLLKAMQQYWNREKYQNITFKAGSIISHRGKVSLMLTI